MLIKAKTLKGYKLDAKDGKVGHVKEFYFDDQHWAVRYLVADTGNWLTGRQVLISPYAIDTVNEEAENIGVNLSKKQIEKSPSLDSDIPVSQQFELEFYSYYRWPTYWGGTYMWGAYPYIMRDSKEWKALKQEEKSWDLHLRSTNEVTGYHIQANDGEIGHVEDFIIDDETWAIRYLIIDTKNWWTGKKVLVSPLWNDHTSWDELKIFINLSRESIKSSPEYSENSLLTRDYEIELHRHYHRHEYWADELAEHKHSQ